MSLRYLMDKNLNPLYKTQLLLKQSNLIVCAIGAIWMVLFIFLYNLTMEKVHEHPAKKLAVQ